MGNKKYNLYNVLSILLVFILYFISGYSNLFLYTLSSSLYLILINIFSNFSIKDLLKKYRNVEYFYTLNKAYKYSLIFIILVDAIVIILSLILGKVIENMFNIVNVKFIFFSMALSLVVVPLINITSDYLSVNKIKFSKYLFNVYNVINFILTIIICNFTYNTLKLPNSINISLIFYTNIISFVIIYFYVYIKYLIKIYDISITKKREEKMINYKKSIVKCFVLKYHLMLEKIIKYSYLYVSIIFMYYTLTYQYGYDFEFTSNVINIAYLFCFRLIYLVILIILSRNKKQVRRVREKEIDFNEYIIKYVNNVIPVSILLVVISKYIWLLIFNNKDGMGILMWGFLLVIFITISNILLFLSSNNGRRNVLIFGLIIKLILTIPMISSFYRLGYNLVYGDMLTNILTFLVMIIYNLIFIRNKYSIKFLSLLEKIIKIVYRNILLCSILVVLQLLLPFSTDNRLNSIIIITIYLIVMGLIKIGYTIIKNNKLVK